MKMIKIGLSIVCLLIVVWIFAMGALIYFVDPDKLKPVMIEEVKKETGYLLAIEGKLSWSIYPRLAVKADRLQLRETQQSPAFVDASEVCIATNMLKFLQSHGKLQGKITIKNLVLMNLKAEDVSANMDVTQNGITLNAIRAAVYGGKLQAALSGRNFPSHPEWQWECQLDKIQLKPLLQDLNGSESKIKIAATGSFRMQANTSGMNRDQLLRKLNGSSAFNLEDGIVEGMDFNYFLQLADAMLHKQPIDQLINSNQTTFTRLNGTASIKNGVANTTDTMLFAPTFITHMEGSVEIISRNLDFNLAIRPQLQNKLKWDIPVLLAGNLDNPDAHLDMMGIQKMLAGIEIQNLKQKAAEHIQKHIRGKTGQLLQNLLNNQD